MSQMKSASLGLVVIAALVGGAAGAGATWALSREPARGAKSKAATPSKQRASEEDAEAMAYRLDRLENELRAFRKQRQSTDALQKYAQALDKKPPGPDGVAPAAEGDAQKVLDPVLDAEDPSFELAVRTVLDRVDWEREEERKVSETKRREERAQRQTELLAQRLKLNPGQTQKVQQILVDQMDTFRKMREAGEDAAAPRPSSRLEWRTRVDTIRTETERKLAEVLDDDQMTSYRSFVEEEGFGQPGSRRRGGVEADANP